MGLAVVLAVGVFYAIINVMVDIVGRIAGQPPSVEMILGVSGAAAMAGVAAFALAAGRSAGLRHSAIQQ